MRIPWRFIPVWLIVAAACWGQVAPDAPPPDAALVDKALAAELAAAQDTAHPMRFRLHKTSPRLTTTKDIVETRDGSVAMLVAVYDKPLTTADATKEQARLQGLLEDPARQRHRKLSEDEDSARAYKVLRALPGAFIYRDAGPVAGASGSVEKFTFTPNPKYFPPDLETQVLTQLYGEIWIDLGRVRVVRLEGHLQDDVDFGWGILGRLNKGGWITIDQAEVGDGQWRIVKFQMSMSGRVLFKARSFDTTEEESQFAPVSRSLDYRQAIAMLLSEMPAAKPSTAAGR